MIHLSVVLVHNKEDLANYDQIDALDLLLDKNEDVHDILDEEGNPTGETYSTYHYEFKDLTTPHQVKVLQIVPYGVSIPKNIDKLDSHKVFYRKGDEDKTGDHPRFFNWGLKRGVDLGADVVFQLGDVEKLDITAIESQISKLADKTDTTEFVEDGSGVLTTSSVLKTIGQLDESTDKVTALEEYKLTITNAGSEVVING